MKYLLLIIALLTVFCLDIAFGSVTLPLADVAAALTGKMPSDAASADIIWLFRLPKACTAALAGAALAVSGLLMQTLFRNPLADPSILGVSSGAGLGVAVVVLAFAQQNTGGNFLKDFGSLGNAGMMAASALGAAGSLAVILVAARFIRSLTGLLIIGVLFGYLTNAIVTILVHFSQSEQVHAYLAWTFGSFGGVTWGQLRVFAPIVLIGIAGTFVLAKPLNALLFGEQYARSLGMALRPIRMAVIGLTALLCGAVTVFCGPIAFIGIAAPHLCRAIFQASDHRALIPAVVLMGAIAALSADVIAQMPGMNIVLPINAVTSLLGAPIVIGFLINTSRHRGVS